MAHPATPALGLGASLPHRCKDAAHLCHFYAGTGFANATSARGLGTSDTSLPHLRRDSARTCQLCIGPGAPRPHLHRVASMRLHWFYLCARCLSADRVFCDHRTRRLGPCHRRASPIDEVRHPPFPQRPLAIDFGFDEGEAHVLRAARWAVRWICRPTYAFRVFFAPSGAVWAGPMAASFCSRACRPSPAARARWTIEATTTKPQRQPGPSATVKLLGCLPLSRT